MPWSSRRSLKLTAFGSISLKGWRQFSDVNLDLSKQVTVLTGQNGTGKTTVLNTLNKHFGWNIQFVSTPYLGKRTAKRLWSDVYGHLDAPTDESKDSLVQHSSAPQPDWIEQLQPERKSVGSIAYDNGKRCELTTETLVSSQYQLSYHGLQAVRGLHVPSHTPATVYQAVATIPTEPTAAASSYQKYQQLLQQTHLSNKIQNPGLIQKQSLISMMVFGEGNSSVVENPEFIRIMREFEGILRVLLPRDLGFLKLEIRLPEIVLITRTGTFSLDAMSGGISALFGLAWQIHMFGRDQDICTVTIDEPENHLHPSMQRHLLPSLSAAFPSHRFIVATHSPFVVTSFPEANVYGLVYNKERRSWQQQVSVESRLLSQSELAGTPNTILREILDVESNLPVWVERQLQEILNDESMDQKDKARKLLDRLRALGIADDLPDLNRDK